MQVVKSQLQFDINHHEYGIKGKYIDIHFTPSEFGILENYQVEKEIYKVMLSPTIITLTRRKDNDKVTSLILSFWIDRNKEEHLKGQIDD